MLDKIGQITHLSICDGIDNTQMYYEQIYDRYVFPLLIFAGSTFCLVHWRMFWTFIVWFGIICGSKLNLMPLCPGQ